jgi:hypothetical protein
MNNHRAAKAPHPYAKNQGFSRDGDNLRELLALLPTKVLPMSISQQFQVAKLNRLLSAPPTQAPDAL